MENLIVSFRGRQADRHMLPAYDAAQSIYGISRSLLIVTNYLSEGRVRRKNFDSVKRGYQINLVAQQPGSFEFLFQIVADPAVHAIGHAVAAKVAGDFTVAFIKSVFRMCVGKSADKEIEALEENGTLKSGDLGALVEAIEPAMRAAHTSINRGATTIVLVQGDNNIVNLDARTKAYVYDSVESGEIQQKLFSIASFNANGFSGRAYDYEEGRTIPFDLAKNADRATIAAMMRSMSTYAMRNLNQNMNSAIALEYTETEALDGRVKKMHVIKARAEIADL
jgi:hypothetical protein